MTGYLLRRVAAGIVTLWLFVTIVFVLLSTLLPYDYASRFGFGCAPCALEVRQSLGLDRPLAVQYVDYLGGLVSGSLGTSFAGEPVTTFLSGDALWRTVLMFAVGSVLAFGLGAWLGRLAAWRRVPGGAAVINATAILLYSAFPPFLVFVLLRYTHDPMRWLRDLLGLPADERFVWAATTWSEPDVLRLVGLTLLAAVVAAVGIRAMARRRRWPVSARWLALPVMVAVAVGVWALAGVLEPALNVLFHGPRFRGIGAGGPAGGNAFLGLLGFTLLAFGEITLVVDTGMAGERDEQYVQTARAKGLPDDLVRDRHVARNAILPALSRFVVGLPLILTGLMIVERELGLGGLSTEFFAAVERADIPVMMGALVAFGAIAMLARLALEVVHAWLDPRLRTEVSR